MKKQTLITIAVVFTMLVFAGSAFSGNYGCGKRDRSKFCQGDVMNKGFGYGFGKGFAYEWAKLSDDQKKQINSLHQKFIDDTATQRAAKTAKHEEIKILMETSSPDRDRLILLSGELGDLKKELMVKRIDFALEAKKIAPELNISMGFHKFGMSGKRLMKKAVKAGRPGCPALEQNSTASETAGDETVEN